MLHLSQSQCEIFNEVKRGTVIWVESVLAVWEGIKVLLTTFRNEKLEKYSWGHKQTGQSDKATLMNASRWAKKSFQKTNKFKGKTHANIHSFAKWTEEIWKHPGYPVMLIALPCLYVIIRALWLSFISSYTEIAVLYLLWNIMYSTLQKEDLFLLKIWNCHETTLHFTQI